MGREADGFVGEACRKGELTAAANTFLNAYKKQIQDLAARLYEEPMPKLTEELFALFEQNGSRLQYEAAYFARRRLLAVYGMAVLLFHEEKDVTRLTGILEDVCQEECWALPAHVNRRENASWRQTVDLFAAETAQALAEITALGKEWLPEGICALVKRHIEERVLSPFFMSRPPYMPWEGCGHNWNAVCAGAVGSACLYVWSEDKARLSACLDRLTASLPHYLDGFMEDGACMEGVDYFTYGMTYYIGFAEQLRRATNGERDLLAVPKLAQIARFQQQMYFKGGRTVSFSDSSTRAKFRMGLALFLSGQYDGVELPDLRLACDFDSDTCYRFMALYRDYYFTAEFLKKGAEGGKEREKTLAEGSRHSVFPYAQWSVCESANGAGMAAKGGHNAEPHNHNDIGSFLYLVKDELLLTDLGAGEYTEEYFGRGRYQILCNSSFGHSVPVIDGEAQGAGRAYACDGFWADGKGRTRISFGGAYREGLLRRAVRELRFDLENGVLAVTDEFVPEKPLKGVTEQLVTQGEVSIDGSFALIFSGRYGCRVALPEEAFDIRCVKRLHKNHEGKEETVRLLQWELPAAEPIRTEFIIEPLEWPRG